jgi:hypothetical protein
MTVVQVVLFRREHRDRGTRLLARIRLLLRRDSGTHGNRETDQQTPDQNALSHSYPPA